MVQLRPWPLICLASCWISCEFATNSRPNYQNPPSLSFSGLCTSELLLWPMYFLSKSLSFSFQWRRPNPQKNSKCLCSLNRFWSPHFSFFLLVLISGFGLMSPVHLNFWNSWFCCLNRVENGGFQSCVWVLLLLSLMLLYSLFCLPLFWWDSRRSLDLTRFSVLGSGFLFLVFICLGFVFLKSKYFWTVAVFYL